MLKSQSIEFRLSPPLRSSKNELDSKHRIISSILTQRMDHSGSFKALVASLNALRISGELHGSEILSALEMAHGFSCTIMFTHQELLNDLAKVRRDLKCRTRR